MATAREEVPAQRAAPASPVSTTADLLTPPSPALRAALWFASRSLRAMGPARYRIADVLGTCTYLFSPASARRCAANHLRFDPRISHAEARARARGTFREFMRTSFDFVWEYAMSPARMRGHFTAEGVAELKRALREERGAVIALAHYGSWDVAAAIALSLDIPITTVMTTVGDSDLATRIAAWARRHQDLDVLMTRGAATGLLRAVRRGRADAILCDIPDRGQREIVDFCNGRVAFSTAPAWIARTMRVPLFAAHCWREDGHYRLVVSPPLRVTADDSDASIMQRVATLLEPQMRRMPTQWYPFGRVYKD